jgi:hypothetical protein
MAHGHSNGRDHSFDDLLQKHDQRFDSLEEILRRGFGDLTQEMRGIRDVLVEAAAGKKQVPLTAFTFTQAIWAILCLLLLVKISMVDLDITATGARFKSNASDNPKISAE